MQHGPGIAQYRHVALDVFVELCGVDVDVNDSGLSGILGDVARNPVVKPHADGDEQVALVGLDVRGHAAVHAQHAFVERVVGGYRREPQQGTAHRYVGLLGQAHQLLLGIGDKHPLAGQYERFARLIDEAGSCLYLVGLDGGVGVIAANELAGLIFIFGQSRLGIFGDVEHNRSRTAGPGDVEGAGYGPGNLAAVAYLVAPFRDRLGDTYHIGLLEGIGAQERRAHLPGDDDERRAVHHGVRQAGDDIGRCRAPR